MSLVEDVVDTPNDDDKTEELCQLFTSIVTSLSADSQALKELICLKVAIGDDGAATHVSGTENMDPNTDNRTMHKSGGKTSASKTIENLGQIEEVVTELEQKMYVLRDILNDEEEALEQLQAVKEAAGAQNNVLNHLVNTTNSLQLPGDDVSSFANRRELMHDSPNMSEGSTGHVVHEQRRKANEDQIICIPRVTASEFQRVPREVRGHVCLILLNDAIGDIEKVCRNKYEVLSHRRKPAGKGSQRALQLDKQYRQQLIAHRELEVKEHGDLPWVSEQELRLRCAFFRAGESTARSILTILRTVKRLKQVRGKKPCEVTYVICQKGT